MNEYNFNVKFEKGRISTNLKKLVQNDYNSTKINFTFDKDGRKVFKMLLPDGTPYVTDIENDELIFGEGVLSQDGTHEVEIALYTEDGRLTDYATIKFEVRAELIQTDEIIELDDRLPILDTLIQEVTQIKNDAENGAFDGEDGEDGITPTIGENGNWFIGMQDTGFPSRGEKGEKGEAGGVSIEEVKAITGELEDLSTEDKSNLVNAINEVASNSGGTVGFYTMSVYVPAPTLQSAYSTTEIKEKFRQIIQDVYNSGQSNAIINMYNSSGVGSTKIFSIQGKLHNKPTSISFMEALNTGTNRLSDYTVLQNSIIQCSCSWDENNNVTITNIYNYVSIFYYLSTTNTNAYTPTRDYHPATKKYVDDTIASAIEQLRTELGG